MQEHTGPHNENTDARIKYSLVLYYQTFFKTKRNVEDINVSSDKCKY